MIPLKSELAALFALGVDPPLPDPEFDRLSLAVFAYQFERNAPYRAYCGARGRTPGTVTEWTDIPALPTAAFKEADLTTVPPEQVRVTYHTSGTTLGAGRPGRHLLPDTALYDASLLPNFQAHVLPDGAALRMLVCGPSARYFPHSSLGHMHSRVLEEFGAPGSGIFWRDDGPQFAFLAEALARAEEDAAPACLLGTVFGFVHFLDWLAEAGRSCHLPPGSRIMDTGGYKGRSREVPREELLALYQARLGVPPTHVVNEYGMTELGSQFYDRVLRDRVRGTSGSEPRLKVAPPWVRVRVVHPETLATVPKGEVGLLRFVDLANLHSVLAVQTDDLGRWSGEGFELLGRAAGAEPRGCSLAVEEFFADAGVE